MGCHFLDHGDSGGGTGVPKNCDSRQEQGCTYGVSRMLSQHRFVPRAPIDDLNHSRRRLHLLSPNLMPGVWATMDVHLDRGGLRQLLLLTLNRRLGLCRLGLLQERLDLLDQFDIIIVQVWLWPNLRDPC